MTPELYAYIIPDYSLKNSVQYYLKFENISNGACNLRPWWSTEQLKPIFRKAIQLIYLYVQPLTNVYTSSSGVISEVYFLALDTKKL